ncbi:MAG: hypothetical protein H5U06_00770 [Candidatus Aminicenantes bacterium]|nr:hypothetical protein [Candidatus Aminicenantes bacterium]
MIDINREFETDNLNYLRLWYLVSSPQEIVVSVTDRVSYIDRRNEIKASIITPLQETGIQGLTVFPSDGRPEAVNVHYRDYILCAISPFLDKSAMGMTLAHELYGHAFLYVRNRPFQHELGKTGGFDPQGYVNRYIMRIEERRY